jgi:hypothetical protein
MTRFKPQMAIVLSELILGFGTTKISIQEPISARLTVKSLDAYAGKVAIRDMGKSLIKIN